MPAVYPVTVTEVTKSSLVTLAVSKLSMSMYMSLRSVLTRVKDSLPVGK